MENSFTTLSLAYEMCTLQTRGGNGEGIPPALGAGYRIIVLNDIIVKFCNIVLNRSP